MERPLPENVVVSRGEPISLDVKFTGQPQPDVTWLKNGVEIEPDLRTQVSAQPDGASRLHIDHAEPTDSGSYSARAANPLGKASTRCDVDVKRMSWQSPVSGEWSSASFRLS